MLEQDYFDVPLPSGSYELFEKRLGQGGICASDDEIALARPLFQRVLDHPVARESAPVSEFLYRAMGFFPLHLLARWLMYLPESCTRSIGEWAFAHPESLLRHKLEALILAVEQWNSDFDLRFSSLRNAMEESTYAVRMLAQDRLNEIRGG